MLNTVEVKEEIAQPVGGVHHVALRVPDMDAIAAWPERLAELGHGNSGVVDRHWFRSVYVRGPRTAGSSSLRRKVRASM